MRLPLCQSFWLGTVLLFISLNRRRHVGIDILSPGAPGKNLYPLERRRDSSSRYIPEVSGHAGFRMTSIKFSAGFGQVQVSSAAGAGDLV